MRRFGDCRDDFRRVYRVFHQRAALSVADDFRHGTAHIDIQQRIASVARQFFRRARHHIRLMAENLQSDCAAFAVIDAEQLSCRAVILGCKQIPLRADHLADCHRAAHFMAEGAEGHVGHARHRGEHCALFQKIKVHRFLRGKRLGLRPKPCQKPEVSGLPSYCFAVYREAMWKVSGTQFLTGAWGRAPS